MVREHYANEVVMIYKVPTEYNFADPFTKAVNSRMHGDLFHVLMSN